MKNLVKLIGATLALTSTAAMATPQYTGNTYGSGMGAVDPTVGYFLWNNENSPDDWSLRWTADNTNLDSVVSWKGEVSFRRSSLGDVEKFQFEMGGTYGDTVTTSYDDDFADSFRFTAATNNKGGVDGLDFAIDSNIELLQFSLGSSLFDGLSEIGDPGVASQNIYIGSEAEGTNVLRVERNGMVYQEFEISVPEPASLALLGLGLLGLGLNRRKKAA